MSDFFATTAPDALSLYRRQQSQTIASSFLVQKQDQFGGQVYNRSNQTIATISTLLGANAIASGNRSTAIGAYAYAKEDSATAVGIYAQAWGQSSIAIGDQAKAVGYRTISLGAVSSGSGLRSIAIGVGAVASGQDSIAIGTTARATGANSQAIGTNARASGASTIAIGDSATATATSATAVGYSADATGVQSTAIGDNSSASALQSTAIGALTSATGNASLAAGEGAQATAASTVAVGQGATASATNATALGVVAAATGAAATAIGNSTTVAGNNSTAVGASASTSTTDSSLALGASASCTADNSIAIGLQSSASATGAVAIGRLAASAFQDSVALGTAAATTTSNQLMVGAVGSLIKLNSAANPLGNIFSVLGTFSSDVLIGSRPSTLDPANDVALDVQNGAIFTQGALGFYASGESDPRNIIYRGGTDVFVFRNYNQEYTIMYVWAPPGAVNVGNRESTFTLQRGDEPDNEFVDFYNNGYNTGPLGAQFEFGIRANARGTGILRPFKIGQSTVANVNHDQMTFAANKDVTIHSVNVPSAFNVDGTTGASSFGAVITGTADVLSIQRSTTAQELRVFGTTTLSKHLSLKHDGTNAIITTSGGKITVGGGNIEPTTDNAVSLGQSNKRWSSVVSASFYAYDSTFTAPIFMFHGGTDATIQTTSGGINLVPASGRSIMFYGPARLNSYTVATLPAGTQGDTAYVTDALAPAFLTAVVDGGAAVTPVFYNGTNWVGY